MVAVDGQRPNVSFSDNLGSVHPAVEAVRREVDGLYAGGDLGNYGGQNDRITQEARDCMVRDFGDGTQALFVMNGTASNVMGVAAGAACRPGALTPGAVLCAASAHIATMEAGALGRTGIEHFGVPTAEGKLSVDALRAYFDDCMAKGGHSAAPAVVSISNATEQGRRYTREEISAIADFAHQRGLKVHMDGSWLAQAAEAQGLGLRASTRDLGVDILSLGGIKNGLDSEALLLFDLNIDPAELFRFTKHHMQVGPKMCYLAAPWLAYLGRNNPQDNIWQPNARQANHVARHLANCLRSRLGDEAVVLCETNRVHARLTDTAVAALQRAGRRLPGRMSSDEPYCFTANWQHTPEDAEQYVEPLGRIRR